MPERIYSTDPFTPHVSGPLPRQAPFTAYAEIYPDPANGKRSELVNQLSNKWAAIIQEDLDDVESLTIAKPIAFTPQFAQAPPRVTIHGMYDLTDGSGGTLPFADENGKPNTSDVTVESSNQFKTGNRGGSLSRGQTPTDTVNQAVAELKEIIEGSVDLPIRIFKIEFAGIHYGRGGYTFPT